MTTRQARLTADHSSTRTFLCTHVDLIEKYMDAQNAPDHLRLPIRKVLAQHARETFGYSPLTSDCDIVFRVIKMYRKS